MKAAPPKRPLMRLYPASRLRLPDPYPSRSIPRDPPARGSADTLQSRRPLNHRRPNRHLHPRFRKLMLDDLGRIESGFVVGVGHHFEAQRMVFVVTGGFEQRSGSFEILFGRSDIGIVGEGTGHKGTVADPAVSEKEDIHQLLPIECQRERFAYPGIFEFGVVKVEPHIGIAVGNLFENIVVVSEIGIELTFSTGRGFPHPICGI